MTYRSLTFFGLACLVLAGGATYEAHALRVAEREIGRLERLADGTRQQIAATRRMVQENESAAELAAQAQPKDPFEPTGDATFDVEARQVLREVYALRQWFDRNPAEAIPELRYAPDSDWFETVQFFQPWNPSRLGEMASLLRARAQMDFLSRVDRALDQYLEAKDGNLPKEVSELAAYFSGPIDDAALARYRMVATGRMRDVADGEPVLEERMSPEQEDDARMVNLEHMRVRVPPSRETTRKSPVERAAEKRSTAVFEAIERYKRSHDGTAPTDAQQLRSYVNDPAVLEGITLTEDGFSYRERE